MTLASNSARQGHMKGFTLIELLVVIAIIGILSSVVLASLNTARNKGADAAVKSNLAGARAQAELFYDANTNAYVVTAGGTTDVCSSTGTVGGVKGIYSAVLAAASATGLTAVNTTIGTAQSGTTGGTAATCHATATAWAASVPTKTGGSGNTYYCVDSTGATKSTDTVLAANIVACP